MFHPHTLGSVQFTAFAELWISCRASAGCRLWRRLSPSTIAHQEIYFSGRKSSRRANVTPVMNCGGRARCHCAWRRVTPPSRLLLAAGHSISVIVCVEAEQPCDAQRSSSSAVTLAVASASVIWWLPDTLCIYSCLWAFFLWMSKSNFGGRLLESFTLFSMQLVQQRLCVLVVCFMLSN